MLRTSTILPGGKRYSNDSPLSASLSDMNLIAPKPWHSLPAGEGHKFNDHNGLGPHQHTHTSRMQRWCIAFGGRKWARQTLGSHRHSVRKERQRSGLWVTAGDQLASISYIQYNSKVFFRRKPFFLHSFWISMNAFDYLFLSFLHAEYGGVQPEMLWTNFRTPAPSLRKQTVLDLQPREGFGGLASFKGNPLGKSWQPCIYLVSKVVAPHNSTLSLAVRARLSIWSLFLTTDVAEHPHFYD